MVGDWKNVRLFLRKLHSVSYHTSASPLARSLHPSPSHQQHQHDRLVICGRAIFVGKFETHATRVLRNRGALRNSIAVTLETRPTEPKCDSICPVPNGARNHRCTYPKTVRFSSIFRSATRQQRTKCDTKMIIHTYLFWETKLHICFVAAGGIVFMRFVGVGS